MTDSMVTECRNSFGVGLVIGVTSNSRPYERPNGYAIVETSELLCDQCTTAHQASDPENVGLGVFETDTPTHCDKCETLIFEPLTREGVEYVREALTLNDGRPEVLAIWRETYADYL